MRNLVLALALFATPALARSKPATTTGAKAAHAGAFCSKDAKGTTRQDAKGASIESSKSKVSA